MNAYQEMQDRQQKEFNSFPCFFAFGQEQFDEGMKKLGLKPGDTKLIYRAPGGMYYRKTDSDSLKEMMARFDREKEAAIVGDTLADVVTYCADINFDLTEEEKAAVIPDEKRLANLRAHLKRLDRLIEFMSE